MKVKAFITCLIAISCFYGWRANAQVRVDVNVNIGSQPLWGPVGYDNAQYYYMPDIDVYYYIPNRQFIYLNGNRWIFASSLPSRYRYDLYRGYKVVINDPRPYLHADVYRGKYGRYKGWYGRQTVIRDSHDERYFQGRNNGHGNKDNRGYGSNQGRGHKNDHNKGGHGNGRGNSHGHGNNQ
ncbi:hypothetical protein [Chitinophaga sp. MM2321]|uniref:hypothetical protein n=1 Tax=Chitinophaga sp. MM2321 TaxID=3137178 RepID=UPI0032D596E2